MKKEKPLSAQIDFKESENKTLFVLKCFDTGGIMVESKEFETYSEAESEFFNWLNITHKGD